MIEIQVGKDFPLILAQEGAMIDLKEEGFVLIIGMNDIIEEEIRSFKKDEIIIDITYINDIIFFVADIGSVMFTEMPFRAGFMRNDKTPEEILERGPNETFPIYMYLVETNDNTLKAIRLISLTDVFSNTIDTLIRKQLEVSCSESVYDGKLLEIQNKLSPIDIKKLSTAQFSTKYN